MGWTSDELGQLIDRHSAALALYSRNWLASGDDIVQDAFCALVAQSTRPDDVLAWLYCVVRRRSLNAARSERRRRRHEHAASQQRPSEFQPSSESELDSQLVQQALQQIDEREREAIVLRVWSGLTFEQMSEVMNVSVSTAQRRYEAALVSLKLKMSPSWQPNLEMTRP